MRDVESVLDGAVRDLDAGGAVTAYERLSGAVKGLGPAFFTKFLYFAQVDTPIEPPALILDARVAAACGSIARSVMLGAGTAAGLAEDLAWWQWSEGGWTRHRYGIYLAFVTGLATYLEEAGEGLWPRARPDAVELALFDTRLLGAGFWS